MTPSASLLNNLQTELRAHSPFGEMRVDSVKALVASARQSYFAPGETVLEPGSGVVQRLLWVRRGAVTAYSASAQPGASGDVHFEAGQMFPIAALLGARAVTSRYVAVDDLFCLEFDAELVRRVIAADPALSDYMHRRVQHLLELSRQALQASYSSRVLAEQSFEAPLSSLPRRKPVAVAPDAPLAEGLQSMQRAHVGSVLVVDGTGTALGILTRHDLLSRVVLRDPPLDIHRTPMREVMTHPVRSLDVSARVHDAALLMSRHGIRHLPLTEQGRVVGVVSERDLFALQRLSLQQLSGALGSASEVPALVALAPKIREFARDLLAQGLAARTLTDLVSHLNDLLTKRLVELLAAAHGLDLARVCWLAFGSEGRGEQTISTDQDNGLVLADEVGDDERAAWLAMAREANRTLDACGYPLCKGGIMAGNEACCLRQREWSERFAHWMEHGAPEDLLNASIYFDLRPLVGNDALATPLRAQVTERAAAWPRFIRQLAENSLRLRPALNWHGGLDAVSEDGAAWVDLKLRGTAIYVDAARLFALAQGVDEVGTRARFETAGAALGASTRECETWVGAFEVLQMLRLGVQIDRAAAQEGANPNRIDIRTLNDIDRGLLKEAMRIARRLQQRITLDWMR
jgi:CBS domain-containing protein